MVWRAAGLAPWTRQALEVQEHGARFSTHTSLASATRGGKSVRATRRHRYHGRNAGSSVGGYPVYLQVLELLVSC